MRRDKKILIYKIGCVLFAAFLLLLPQRSVPYNNVRVLAIALGVDGSEGQITVTAQLAVPVSSGSDGKASAVAKASGNSVGEALESMEIGIGRRVDYGHLTTVALGKDADYSSAKNTVSYMLSSGKVGACAFLVFCPDATASEFISQAQSLGDSSDAELGQYVSYFKSSNQVSTVSVLQFLQSVRAASHAAFVPCVRLADEGGEQNGSKQQGEQKQGDGQQSGQGGGKQQEGGEQQQEGGNRQEEQKSGGQQESGGQGGKSGESSEKKMLVADTVAVFGGESNAPSVLNVRATQGIAWQDEHSRFGLVELKDVVIDGQTEKSVTARLTGKRVHAKLRHAGGNACVYHIKAKLRLESAQILGSRAAQRARKKALEREFERLIENNVLYAATVSKETGVDFLELRTRFHRYCSKGYRTFDLATTAVEVKAKVEIIS